MNDAGIGLIEPSFSEVDQKSGLSVKTFQTIQNYAITNVVHTEAPLEVDYYLAVDPYLAKFGPERRKVEISKSLLLASTLAYVI